MKHMTSYLALVALTVLAFALGRPAQSPAPIELAQQDASMNGYVRASDAVGQPYTRSARDGNPYHTFGFPGNVNPYTGTVAHGTPDSYVRRYGVDTTAPYHTWNGYPGR